MIDTSVSLTWLSPVHDGGGELVGYVVEVLKEGDETWIDCSGKEPVINNHFTVGAGLFKFRVAEVNQIGQG